MTILRHYHASAVQFFFFNDTATTEIYTLSLHDALPIWLHPRVRLDYGLRWEAQIQPDPITPPDEVFYADFIGQTSNGQEDRKSTRLNSSHANISYAVFCLKKKKKHYIIDCLYKTNKKIM